MIKRDPFWLLTFWLFTAPSPFIECQKVSSALEIVSKSIFCTLFRVIYQLSVLFEVNHGPQYGPVTRALTSLGLAQHANGQRTDARRNLERALRLEEAHLGKDQPPQLTRHESTQLRAGEKFVGRHHLGVRQRSLPKHPSQY